MLIEIKVPPLGESITEATLAKLYKKQGDVVKSDEMFVELETDKVTLEVNIPVDGVISEVRFKEGDDVKIGDILALMEEGDFKDSNLSNNDKNLDDFDKKSTGSDVINKPLVNGSLDDNLSPSVKKLVSENDVDLSKVTLRSGKDGRVTKGDVLNFISNKSDNSKKSENIENKHTERVRMSKLRQKIAERLKESQNTAAILTTFNEVDMTNIINLRSEYKDKFQKKYDVKLGFMSFFIKSVVCALKEIPVVNAEIDGEEIVYKNFYDIGVAVGSPQGLVVPVVRDADKLNLAAIESSIMDLSIKAREGKLQIKDLTNATFTISNGGVYGSLLSTPIINPPQSGILGMHNIVKRPVVINDEIKIRSMMYLALSYDHRIVDGKEAVTFLVRIKDLIEDPRRLLLNI